MKNSLREPAKTKFGIRKLMGIVIPLIVLLLIPHVASSYVVYVIILAMLYAMLTASYDLLLGYTGQLSFCQGAFYGIGAYTSALLTLKAGLPFWAALPISALFTFVVGAGVGYPALRLRGAYFAVTTFFFGHLVYLVILNSQKLTGGPLGLRGIPPPESFLGIDFSKMTSSYYLILVFAVLMVVFLYRLVRSGMGKIFVAIREDQDFAEAIGINTAAFKVLSFSISAGLAGLVGSLFAHFFRLLHPSTFAWMTSEMVVIMTLFGGAGTLFGPILGAGIVTFVLEVMRFAPEFRYVIWAIALIVVLVFEPKGLIGIIGRLRRRK